MKKARKYIFTVLLFICLALAFFVSVSWGSESQSNGLFEYLSPRPGAEWVSAESTIAFRLTLKDIIESGSDVSGFVSVTADGGRSGRHQGKLLLAGDGETIIFEPDLPFIPNEIVTVSIKIQGRHRPVSYQYSFTISSPKPIINDIDHWSHLFPELPDSSLEKESADPLPQYRTVPNDFPNLDVYTAPGTGDGYVFLSHYNYSNSANGKAYLLMLGDSGEPVYYKRLHPLLAALDFKKQSNGLLTYFDAAQKVALAMDNQYNIVGSYQAGNGYETDLHDIQLLDNNNALLLANDYQIIDMSVIVSGGNPAALVVGCIIQEVDVQGNVIFEWRSWDHIPITDSNQDLTADRIWYMHCNSVEKDADGHILISSRHLDEVTKINRQTGDIIWRLGGKQNEFTFPNDPGFFYQHDARRLPNGRLSIYDNRTYQEPAYSRAVEYVVDEVNKVATLVYEYRHTPDVLGGRWATIKGCPGAMFWWGGVGLITLYLLRRCLMAPPSLN